MKNCNVNLGIQILLFVAIALAYGCAGSPYRTQASAEQHKKAMVNLQPDMSPSQVQNLMGPPDKTELYRGKNEKPILIYLYITEGKDTYTRKWSEANYTPLVFVDQKLMGWGWNYLNGTAKKYEFVIKDLY